MYCLTCNLKGICLHTLSFRDRRLDIRMLSQYLYPYNFAFSSTYFVTLNLPIFITRSSIFRVSLAVSTLIFQQHSLTPNHSIHYKYKSKQFISHPYHCINYRVSGLVISEMFIVPTIMRNIIS